MALAFPGAEGFGKDTVGGRGGTVYRVTNLNDSGSGSLREAVEASGPRIVVFTVGGTVQLEDRLLITNPNITIAGQTAPGGGICIRGPLVSSVSCVNIRASEVILRYLRIRRGEHSEIGNNGDCLSIGFGSETISNIIADHCSLSWSIDEIIGTFYDPFNITIQWCILSEALKSSTHGDGDHSFALLSGGTTDRISAHHNLIASSFWRMPSHDGILLDFVNNVIYNPGTPTTPTGIAPSNLESGANGNFVNNRYIAGLSTPADDHMISTSSSGGNLYVKGNITPQRPVDEGSEVDGVVRSTDQGDVVANPFAVDAVTIQSALEAYNLVLADAGANKRLNADGSFTSNRDSVDERIVSDVQNGTGAIIDHQDDVGGYPALVAGTPYTDTDGDGMPDEWENAQRLDKNNPADGSLLDASGYSNVELFLNGLTRSGIKGSLILGAPSLPLISPGEIEVNEFWEEYFRDIERAQSELS